MSTPDEPVEPAPEPSAASSASLPESTWERRRRMAAIFGDVLPETTRDERASETREDSASDAWFRSQVPPHHG